MYAKCLLLALVGVVSAQTEPWSTAKPYVRPCTEAVEKCTEDFDAILNKVMMDWYTYKSCVLWVPQMYGCNYAENQNIQRLNITIINALNSNYGQNIPLPGGRESTTMSPWITTSWTYDCSAEIDKCNSDHHMGDFGAVMSYLNCVNMIPEAYCDYDEWTRRQTLEQYLQEVYDSYQTGPNWETSSSAGLFSSVAAVMTCLLTAALLA